nr:PREDICTED: transcription initiation factor TFIID subunit 4B [Latimeria chalumnae]|eukprot:XP_014349716.1 PREDICTED: transcription initiation factor TFIID subunit 4B [Latimeria chalumnae]
MAAPQQPVVTRAPQTTSIQLPASFQIPPEMVLVTSDGGQLMLVSQQALARVQAQVQASGAPRSTAPTTTQTIRISMAQTPGAQIVTKPVTATSGKAPSQPVCTATVPRPAVVKSLTTIAPVTVQSAPTVRLVTPATPASVVSQKKIVPTTTKTAATAVEGARILTTTTTTTATSTAKPSSSLETLENVKKCKNFFATLIKLASGGTQSPEMAKNVTDLVKNLLDSKIEAEEFTNKLYTELKSSPQPYLVPFLKRSLPALRQLMPNAQTFIQQCIQQQPRSQPAGAPSASGPGLGTPQQLVKVTSGPLAAISKPPTQTTVITQPAKVGQNAKPVPLVIQHPPAAAVKQVVTAVPQTSALTVSRPVTSTAVAVTARVQPTAVPAIVLQASPVQKTPIKENGVPSFREEDDINDVASMAGVNLSEENARILATNSELVGSVIRSCKDEPFLFTGPLQKKILEIGKKHNITELSSDAVNFISHAAQERLRGLLEKLTVIAQHRAVSYKDDGRYVLADDTRSQLKFLEQLDRIEKQKKEEEEREVLLKAAKSRTNKEDPEQMRLKQKAKEMQQLELAQIQQRDANLTALAAIGPRKKRPLDSLLLGNGAEGSSGSVIPHGISVSGRQLPRQRITRISLRDLIFCMEQERDMKHSLALYRTFLK